MNPENRWVKWSEVIPWDELAVAYYETMNAKQGRPGKDARPVIAALIIKHKLTLSDEEIVTQIQEGVYLQYFAPSLFVDIRKRMGKKVFASF